MDTRNHLRSLGQELESLKHRVRHLIADAHWQTDGEWKESVLRQILRRQLPSNACVGRGFVITDAAASHQLDILIHDSSKPVLFRDGDLVFVTPDAVLGIIEVKSRITPSLFRDAARKLAEDIDLVRLHPNSRAFAALFAFDADAPTADAYLEAAVAAASSWNKRIDFAALGPDWLLKYWEFDPTDESRMYNTWHSYKIANLASGYFIHNVVDAVSPNSVLANNAVWFPINGKEPHRDGSARAIWP